jgi:hypothetical protein
VIRRFEPLRLGLFHKILVLLKKPSVGNKRVSGFLFAQVHENKGKALQVLKIWDFCGSLSSLNVPIRFDKRGLMHPIFAGQMELICKV